MTMPMSTEAMEGKPLKPCLNTRMAIRVMRPSSRFHRLPKSLTPEPPAKKLMPTEISERPMAMTTVPVTTGGKNFLRGLMRKPRPISNTPPTIQAPMSTP